MRALSKIKTTDFNGFGVLFKVLMISSLTFFTAAQAIDIDWSEPYVVGPSSQKGRKVVRFSGQTEPNTTINLDKGGLRYYLADGSARVFSMSSDDRGQFPIGVGGDGTYAFDLNVPVRAIEVPITLKNDGETVKSTMNFRVPRGGGDIDDLTSLEKSYSAEATDDDDNYTRSRGKYTKKRDRGQIITRRKNRGLRNNDRVQVRSKRLNFKVYAGIGPSWVSLHQESNDVFYTVGPRGQQPTIPRTGLVHSESALAIPVWRLGASWDMSPKWNLNFVVRDTPLKYQPNANDNEITFPEGQANWTTARIGVTYNLKELSMGFFGLDFGAQVHSQPYYRLRNYQGTFNYEDARMLEPYIGARLRSHLDRKWPWEAYLHVSVPVYTDSDIFSGSGVGVEIGGGADRELMPGLSLGIWGYVQQYWLDTDYIRLRDTGPITDDDEDPFTSTYSLTSATIEARFTVRF